MVSGSFVATALLLLVAVLGVGGAPWLVLVGCLILGGAQIVAQAGRSREGRRSTVDLVALVLAGVVGFQLLTIVPLPIGLVDLASGLAAAAQRDGWAAAGTERSFGTLSLAPGDTARATACTALACVMVLIVRGPGHRRSRTQLQVALLAVGASVVAAVAVHALLGLTSPYGLYPDLAPGLSQVQGPFVNPNDLGVVCAALLPLASTHVVTTRSFARAWAIAGTLALGLVAVLTFSRGVILAIAVEGLVVFGLLLTRGPRRRGIQLAAGVLVGLLLVGSSAYAVDARFVGLLAPDVLMDLSGRGVVWTTALTMAMASPWVGVGADAFGSVWWSLRASSSDVFFQDAEGLPAQLLATLGVPISLALAGGAVVVLAALLRGAVKALEDGDFVTVAATSGLLGYLAVTTVTMTTSVPGSVLVAVTLYGLTRGAPGLRLRRWVPEALGVGMAVLGVVLVVFSHGAGMSATDRWFAERLKDGLSEGDDPVAMALRHPADPYGYAWAGMLLRRESPGLALRLANHAMRIDPLGAEPHRVAANVLMAAGHTSQAEGEIRVALTKATSAELPRFVEDALALDPSGELMLRVLPLEPDPAVRAARQIARRGSPELALGVWERLATRPSPPSVAVAEVLRLTPPSRIVEAADLVAEARAANPDEPALVLVEAEARLRSGATAEGYGLLRIYLAEAPAEDDVGRSQALVLSAEPRLDQPDAVSVFKSLLALPDAGGHSEGAIRTWLQAEVDLAEGRGAKALRGFRAATDARPDVPLLQARLQRAREVLR